MAYSWEKHIAAEEKYAEQRCRETRQECGLPEDVDRLDCESEPCHRAGVCPFEKGVDWDE